MQFLSPATPRFAVAFLCGAIPLRCCSKLGVSTLFHSIAFLLTAFPCHCDTLLSHAAAKLCVTMPMRRDVVPCFSLPWLRSALPRFSKPLPCSSMLCSAVATLLRAFPLRPLLYLAIAVRSTPCRCCAVSCCALPCRSHATQYHAIALPRTLSNAFAAQGWSRQCLCAAHLLYTMPLRSTADLLHVNLCIAIAVLRSSMLGTSKPLLCVEYRTMPCCALPCKSTTILASAVLCCSEPCPGCADHCPSLQGCAMPLLS